MSTRNYNVSPFAEIDAIRERLGVSGVTFAKMLGYSDTAYSGWRSADAAPTVALLAAEALDRRHQDTQSPLEESTKAQPDRRYMIQITSTGKLVAVTEVPADLDSMTHGGKRYLLLPAGE